MIVKPIYNIIIKELHKKLVNGECKTVEDFMKKVPKKYKITPRKDILSHSYQQLLNKGELKKIMQWIHIW